MGGSNRQQSARADIAALGVPAGLTVETFRVGPDEYAVFSLPLPEWVLPHGLCGAEADVALRLLRGENAERIARARGKSVHTVRNQVRALYAKLRVSSRVELAALCSGAREHTAGSNAP